MCFVYTIYIKYIFGIVMWFLVLTLLYLGAFRKVLKYKSIEFDSENIYFDGKIISLKKIIMIDDGRIYYQENGENKEVIFRYNHFENNIEILREFYRESRYNK